MNWTETRPTEPGWYWAVLYAEVDEEVLVPELVYVNQKGMAELHVPDDGDWDLFIWRWWYGPLAAPPLPQPQPDQQTQRESG